MSRVYVDGRQYLPVPPAPNVSQSFGAYLLTLRQAAGLTQAQAAEASGIQQVELERLESVVPTGHVSHWTMHRLAQCYGVSLDLLVPIYLQQEPTPVRSWVDLSYPQAFEDDEDTLPEDEEGDSDE